MHCPVDVDVIVIGQRPYEDSTHIRSDFLQECVIKANVDIAVGTGTTGKQWQKDRLT